MASTAAERQKEWHQRMLEQGFKKRSFYLEEQALKQLNIFKESHNLENLDVALNKLLKELK